MELRVFLTAAVIMDDLVAIALIALLYTDAIDMRYLLASLAVTGLLARSTGGASTVRCLTQWSGWCSGPACMARGCMRHWPA